MRVYMWGRRASLPASEAGDAAGSDLRSPTEVAWFRLYAERHRCRWRQVAFGPSFGAARTDSGELVLWGSCRSKDGSRQYTEPRPLLLDDGEPGGNVRFRDVQCSASTVWGLTMQGEVIVWERVPDTVADHISSSSSSSPSVQRHFSGGRRLGGMTKPVREMAVGASHAAFIAEDGELYCLGSNRSGECGADPLVQGAATSCRLVQCPRHTNPIARVGCGKSHTVAVGAEGQTLAWGDDSKIQLGLGDTRSNVGDERQRSGSRGFQNLLKTGEGMATPSALRGGADSPSSSRARSASGASYGEFEPHLQWRPTLMMDVPLEFARQVHGTPYPPPDRLECGDDFTILVVRDSPDWFPPEEESNRLFCCGENGRGQCGRSLQQSQQTLAATRLPKNSYTMGVSCGSAHCLAVLKRVGSQRQELWAWGSNDRGQVGGSNPGVLCPAARLRLPRDVRIEAAWCGFAASSVICSGRPQKGGQQGNEGGAADSGDAAV